MQDSTLTISHWNQKTLNYRIICYFQLLEMSEAIIYDGRLGAEGKSYVQIWSRKQGKRLKMLPRAIKAFKVPKYKQLQNW